MEAKMEALLKNPSFREQMGATIAQFEGTEVAEGKKRSVSRSRSRSRSRSVSASSRSSSCSTCSESESVEKTPSPKKRGRKRKSSPKTSMSCPVTPSRQKRMKDHVEKKDEAPKGEMVNEDRSDDEMDHSKDGGRTARDKKKGDDKKKLGRKPKLVEVSSSCSDSEVERSIRRSMENEKSTDQRRRSRSASLDTRKVVIAVETPSESVEKPSTSGKKKVGPKSKTRIEKSIVPEVPKTPKKPRGLTKGFKSKPYVLEDEKEEDFVPDYHEDTVNTAGSSKVKSTKVMADKEAANVDSVTSFMTQVGVPTRNIPDAAAVSLLNEGGGIQLLVPESVSNTLTSIQEELKTVAAAVKDQNKLSREMLEEVRAKRPKAKGLSIRKLWIS